VFNTSLLAIAAALAMPAAAAAEPPADLRLRAQPLPRPEDLKMRVALQDDAAPQPDPEPPAADADAEEVSDVEILDLEASLRAQVRQSDKLGQRRSLDERVVLQASLGVGIDGGQPSEDGTLLSGAELDTGANYADLRTYGFGDLVLGTNGLLSRSLRTYFSTSYRFDRDPERPSTPVPTIYDGEFGDYVVHSLWIDIEEVFDNKLLAPLYLRVGRQFKYGLAVINFEGLSFGYKTRVIRAAGYFGARASPYGFENEGMSAGGIAGFDASVDMFEWRTVPLVLSASGLFLEGRDHLDFAAAFRWRRNMLVRAKLRTLDGRSARQTVRMRGRVSDTTTFTVLIDNQTADDWVYDLLLVEPQDIAETANGEERRYLNLGLPRPRLRVAARAGTVLFSNFDVLLMGAAALEHGDDDEFEASSFRSTYLEGGAAIEVRLRRNLRIGTSGLGRIYRRPGLPEPRPQEIGIPDALPQTTELTGERSFVEGGGFARYSLGARTFNAGAELYGRALRNRSEYIARADQDWDFRSGGRFSLDGWASNRVRLAAVYDLSFATLLYAPELRGIKTLRISVEGTL
jgi:hypothetical protein